MALQAHKATGAATEQPSSLHPWIPALCLLGLGALLVFFMLGRYGLSEPDEGRYAEVAREMLTSGHFLVPHQNYVVYLEKPPLLYWLTALSMYLFGTNPLAARLVSALAALGGAIMTWGFGTRVFDHRRGLLAAAILVTCPLYATMAQVLTTDMLLSVLLNVAFFALFLQLREGGRWWIAAYLAMALAMLTKGLEGAVLPALAIVAFLLQTGSFRSRLRRLHPLAGGCIALALALPWFVYITLRVPGFFHLYVYNEHLRRFFDPRYSHDHPFYYYLPVMAAGAAPWSVLLGLAGFGTKGEARRYCWTVLLVTVGLFSLAHSKMITYILPAFPILALILADSILGALAAPTVRAAHRLFVGTATGLVCAGVALLGLTLAANGWGANALLPWLPWLASPYPRMLRVELLWLSLSLLVTGGALLTALALRRYPAAIAMLTMGTALAILAGFQGRLRIDGTRTYASFAEAVENSTSAARIICYHQLVQSLPFYLQRRVALVGPYLGEMTFGAKLNPDANYFIPDDRALFALWRQPGARVLVVNIRDLPHLSSELGPVRVIAGAGHKLAVIRANGGA